jgi:hypothetical protein
VELQCSAIACLIDADLRSSTLLIFGRHLQISPFFGDRLGAPNDEEINAFERHILDITCA